MIWTTLVLEDFFLVLEKLLMKRFYINEINFTN